MINVSSVLKSEFSSIMLNKIITVDGRLNKNKVIVVYSFFEIVYKLLDETLTLTANHLETEIAVFVTINVIQGHSFCNRVNILAGGDIFYRLD